MKKISKNFLLRLFAIFSVRKDAEEFAPKIQSHRGYCLGEPKTQENTLSSIQKAYDLKFPMVEFDVQITKDQKVILFHDESLNGKKISRMTYKEINAMIHVDLLQDILIWYRSEMPIDFKLNIEIKSKVINGRLEKLIYQLLIKYKMKKNVLISSFNPISLAYFNALDSSIFRALLLSNEKSNKNNFLIKNMILNFMARPNSLHLRAADWDQKLFSPISKLKIPITLWTCNEFEVVDKYFKQGVSGIISDQITPHQLRV